ncbi:MAG: NADH-quinone oxidoreductase subunit NuoK [Planctomycetes bacterium]|nr:NADH-quinone oxidoreductase subunit NuoK [Planctomycetota bacterium]NOG54299.1 NADH-quinone oxidoreductase subunit NuoK [Planctomycetota bacterium]
MTTALTSIGLSHFLVLSAIVFGCGLATVLTKRNAIGILIGVELILNAANLNLVAFNRFSWGGVPVGAGTDAVPAVDGLMFALFIIVLAAAEAAIALAIILNFYNNFASIDVERGSTLRG